MCEAFDYDAFVFLEILQHTHVIPVPLLDYRSVNALVLGPYASRGRNSITIGQRLHYCKQFSKAAFCVQIHNNLNNKYRKQWHWIDHKLCRPQSSIERHTLDWNPQCTRRRQRDKEQPEKEQGMGIANGWKKLERGIRTSLRLIQMCFSRWSCEKTNSRNTAVAIKQGTNKQLQYMSTT
jgi:hypothetical protein